MEIANDNKRKTVKESDVLKALEGKEGCIFTMFISPKLRTGIYKSLSDFLRIILSLLHSEADFDEMIPLIEKELEEVKNKKKQNKKPKNEEANNEEMENW